MIFLAVGTQLPFDRLVQVVDDWASEQGRDDVIGQVGESRIVTKAIKAVSFMPPQKFNACCENASLLIAHAGMGSMLMAMELGKPIIVMPRLARLGEHRNDHQLATAKRFINKRGINVAMDENELRALLLNVSGLTAGEAISRHASKELIEEISNFIARS